MAFLRKDQDYIDAGVEPPEHNTHGDTTIALDNHNHRWIQVGNFIECDGGNHIHGQPFDHMHQLLVGTSAEGVPVFKDIDLQEHLDNTKA